VTSTDDLLSYRRHQSIEQQFSSAIERGPAYQKFILSTYLYWRSRLSVPGRAYDLDDGGMLPIGGSAHCDLMDLDNFLSQQSDADRSVAYYWALDSSPEEVAQLRRSRGYSRSSMSRKRQVLAEKAASSEQLAA